MRLLLLRAWILQLPGAVLPLKNHVHGQIYELLDTEDILPIYK